MQPSTALKQRPILPAHHHDDRPELEPRRARQTPHGSRGANSVRTETHHIGELLAWDDSEALKLFLPAAPGTERWATRLPHASGSKAITMWRSKSDGSLGTGSGEERSTASSTDRSKAMLPLLSLISACTTSPPGICDTRTRHDSPTAVPGGWCALHAACLDLFDNGSCFAQIEHGGQRAAVFGIGPHSKALVLLHQPEEPPGLGRKGGVSVRRRRPCLRLRRSGIESPDDVQRRRT